jgi:hypothetical protein
MRCRAGPGFVRVPRRLASFGFAAASGSFVFWRRAGPFGFPDAPGATARGSIRDWEFSPFSAAVASAIRLTGAHRR